MNLVDLLRISFEREATDLHLTVNSPPVLRIHGQLVFLDQKRLSAKDTEEMVMDLLSVEQKNVFEEKRSIDFGYSVDGLARFRVNAFYQKGHVATVCISSPICATDWFSSRGRQEAVSQPPLRQ